MIQSELRLAKPPTKLELAVYEVTRFASVAFSRFFWRLKVEGLEHVPTTGAFILAPVHRSSVDSLVVAAATKRRMHYMGKKEMWKFRFSAWYFNAMGGIPVDRGTPDRDALRACKIVIDRGEPLVMFPEGTRRSGPVIEDIFDGVAFVAARGGIPIIPVGLGGTEKALPRASIRIRPVHIHMIIGPPLYPETLSESGSASRRGVHELSERLHGEMQRLFTEAELASKSHG
ncbi:MAG: lysophospholipid acyltransferase family protein [Acidimicrobiales bacterium]